jgi:allophanate hydrolase
MSHAATAIDLASLRALYESGARSPSAIVDAIYDRIEHDGATGIFIHLTPRARAVEAARVLELGAARDLPLYGVPFAVKDNIDVEGLPTTAACPAFAYVAKASAPVVARLLDAGAILIGKTNLDQFATGLVGTRSPYGVPANPFDARYVTGGSSSGSAAAVSRGLASFALGTDTAGSGRVPAAFTNLVGLKPSRGLLPTTGVVPACRSLDCVSIFALTCEDARRIANVTTAYAPTDAYSRPEADQYDWRARPRPDRFRFAVPRDADLAPHVEPEVLRAFVRARAHLEALGGEACALDLGPFFEAGRLLYEGPWLAERLEGLESFLASNAESLLPITRRILEGGRRFRATEAYAALHRLEKLAAEVRSSFDALAALLLPTAPNHPRIEDVERDPIGANAKLGLYTSFVNLLDLAAVAVPAGLRDDGLPFGVTLVGRRGSDADLLALGAELHSRAANTLGATEWPVPRAASTIAPSDRWRVAVFGAHLSGQPLNHELTRRRAVLARAARTAPRYRLFALPTTPPKPGLVRVQSGEPGASIACEIWDLPRAEIGSFFSVVTAPLCLGTIELDDGERVAGFICESYATRGAEDISRFGGWTAYLAQSST